MIAALILACLSADPLPVEARPVVEEHYTDVVVVREIGAPEWSRSRVCFFREGQLFDTRIESDEMTWTVHDGQLAVVFDDYGMCSRIITFDRMTTMTTTAEERTTDDKPWWSSTRNMRALAAPKGER